MDDHQAGLQAGSDVPASAPVTAAIEERLTPHFTGSGKEYFRIWLVNLTLTVATLGIYSAWAKVRRLQYFDRNTVLAGAVFDFRGNPWAILRGRLLALLMLAMYHYAFGFSANMTLAILGVLALVLPFLMRGALRFRLQNSQYRGLRFGFTGAVPAAYATFLPVMLVFILPGLLVTLFPGQLWVFWSVALYLLWPLFHARLKAYQHAHVQYGGAQSDYQGNAWRFYRFYLVAIGLLLAAGMALMLVGFILTMVFKAAAPGNVLAGAIGLFAGSVLFYLAVLLTLPFMAARVHNDVWSRSSFPGLHFESDMSARAFARLQLVNVVLTIFTLGLFRPFAVVRIHRFKLAALTVVAAAGFDAVIAEAASGQAGALGDGAADFFGFDLSW